MEVHEDMDEQQAVEEHAFNISLSVFRLAGRQYQSPVIDEETIKDAAERLRIFANGKR